ncbi:MAG: tetratricopeptide repeat protein [Lewinellaceae bacterium]|nr:tetratricopeptide repeat protein [Lewinellaceae bacterium]
MPRKNHSCSVLSFLLIVFLLPPLAAVDINRDSLAEALKKAPENSLQRARILQLLNESYRQDIPDESIFYGKQLIPLARSLGAPRLLYKGHMATGVAYAVRGNAPDTALYHFLQALDIAKKEKGKDWELYRLKSRINITGVHWQLENLESALKYAYQNVAQLESMEDSLTLADAYRTVALIHRTGENYDSTFYYLNKALDIYEREKAEPQKASTLITMGNTYQKEGLYEQAQQVLYRALHSVQLLQDSIILIDTYEGLSSTHLQLNRPDSAEFYARALLQEARRRSLLPEMATSYELLSNLFSSTNQLDSALFYLRRYAALREQLIGEEKARAIQEIDTRYQAQEKARENRMLRKQFALANFRNSLLLAAALLFLLLIVLIAYFNFRLRRRKKELELLNEKVIKGNGRLLALMNEKQHMVSLIAHDIRNPLSLIQLNTFALAQDKGMGEKEHREILTEIEQAADAIDRASLKIMEVENELESQISIQNISFDLVQVLKESVREFGPFARSKSISLEFRAGRPDATLTGDPFLIRHIVANLLSNAIKYSPSGKTVSLSFQNHDGEISFSVGDEGPGLSLQEQKHLFKRGVAFNQDNPHGKRSRGEGLYLTRRYVEAMGGKIAVESTKGMGAVFTVSFPREKTF